MTTNPIKFEQFAALELFAFKHGRNWKQALRACWETSEYDGNAIPTWAVATLHVLRNTRGPSWLHTFRGVR